MDLTFASNDAGGCYALGFFFDLAYLYDSHTPGAIVSDPTRLRQVLINLVGNALKFTEKGEVVVEVSSRLPRQDISQDNAYLRLMDEEIFEEEECMRLKFEVRDIGPGIPADRMDRYVPKM